MAKVYHVHTNEPQPQGSLRIQISFSYSDGFGREIQKKIQAEPGPVVEGGDMVNPRWVCSGWTIFNNKGKPVRQYEPFFSRLSEKRHWFEFGVRVGVSPIAFYDPIGRVVVTLHPNYTYEKVMFDPWKQVTYDVNDTVVAYGDQTGDPRTDIDIQGYTSKYFATLNDPNWQTWFEKRLSGTMPVEEQRAADKAAAHANTPTTAYFDALGRPFMTMTHNRLERNNVITDETYATRTELDIEGKQREVRDAVVQNGDAEGRIVIQYDYDMLGNPIHEISMEAGARWILNDVACKPVRTWDSRDHIFRTEYDPLRRPLRSFVIGADPSNPNKELLTERLVYGEQHPEDELRNLRGKLYLHLDQAGAATSEAYDFKNNPLDTTRSLATEYKHAIDWKIVDLDHVSLPVSTSAKLNPDSLKETLTPLLESEVFNSRIRYDALNRQIQIIVQVAGQSDARRNIIQYFYNEANLLERANVWIDHPTDPNGMLDPSIVQPSSVGVNNIDYDAKGQRQRIDYANGVRTIYEYDPQTFRINHLLTVRNAAAFPDDGPSNPSSDWQGCQVQNLQYTYDPIGNIAQVRDVAQQTIFFRNKRVEPSVDYTYDAIYRLIEANGREHLGQVGGAPTPHSYNDIPRVGLLHPNDGRAMGTYTEDYEYDSVGNLTKMHHRGDEPSNPGWTRDYSFAETSLIENGTGDTLVKFNNRLSSTTVEGNHPSVEVYTYDNPGNITSMPQLQIMQWDYKDQLCMTQCQKVNDEDVDGIKRQGERTYYIYDTTGQRTRKVTELPNGQLKDEHIYLGQFEIYRRYSGANAGLVRETLHIMDDKQRIALVETRNDIDDGTLKQIIRYQFTNHLGSAMLELDDLARIISYEEYYPYGSTSYQAVRGQIDTPKRYRYTGMERDDETGLNYHSTRYYSPWLGRWTSPDPYGLKGGINLYGYAYCNPTKHSDKGGSDPYDELIPGLITDYPRLGQAWDLSKAEALEKAYKQGGVAANMEAFHRDLDKLDPGPQRTKLARKLFKSVRKGFNARVGELYQKGIKALGDLDLPVSNIEAMVKSGANPIKGVQYDHAIRELAENPYSALEAMNIGGRIGHAGVPGGSHFLATEGRKALKLAALAGEILFYIDAGAAAYRTGKSLIKGDFSGAAGELKTFAYDQTVGVIKDVSTVTTTLVLKVIDPSNTFGKTTEKLEKELERELYLEALVEDTNDSPDDGTDPAILRERAQKWAQGVELLAASVALAASAPSKRPTEPSETQGTTSRDLEPEWVENPFYDPFFPVGEGAPFIQVWR
jgi:RHS repeat-associated protein